MTFRGWLCDVTPVASTSAMTKAAFITANAATFGAIIKRLRKAEGWTIAELARRSGFTNNHLSLIELGKNMPGLSTTPPQVSVRSHHPS
jgi:DNA-binding XRE family transcriptional regulator